MEGTINPYHRGTHHLKNFETYEHGFMNISHIVFEICTSVFVLLIVYKY